MTIFGCRLSRVLLLATALGCGAPLVAQTSSPAALATTPPMGWNSWYSFRGRVTDKDVRAAADLLVSTGMRDAGYTYVAIDDTWEGERDAQGIIHPNSRFPDMKALGDYIHARGLKFGIYSSPGTLTCAKFAGSFGHEDDDARTYAAWGVDLLKYDLCSFGDTMQAEQAAHPETPNLGNRMMLEAYQKMAAALARASAATGRPMLYSLCQYGNDHVWTWGASVHAQMWRTTGDLEDTWARMFEIANRQVGLARYAGPGHWNDPDLLQVGRGGMTDDEYRTHMTIWAIVGAPLIASNDLTNISPADLAILLNKDVIRIDQDPLGQAGDRAFRVGDIGVWTRPLSGNRMAIAVVNSREADQTANLLLADLGLPASTKLHDIWTGRDIVPAGGNAAVLIPRHGVALFVVSR